MTLQLGVREADGRGTGADEVCAGLEVEVTRGRTKSAPHTVPYDCGPDLTADRECDARVAGVALGVDEGGHGHRSGSPSGAKPPQRSKGALVVHPAQCHGEVVICREGRTRTVRPTDGADP